MALSLTCRGRYAARAMVDLAAHHGAGPVSLAAIAGRQGLSRKYLQQLMAGMRSAGLVRVAKGSRGGFTLARSPEELTIRQVLAAAEGALELVECLRREDACERAPGCATRPVWAEATRRLNDYFDSVSLADAARGRTPAVLPRDARLVTTGG